MAYSIFSSVKNGKTAPEFILAFGFMPGYTNIVEFGGINSRPGETVSGEG